MSGHLVLFGDSIFDNAAYVPDQPEVIKQVRASLPSDWIATLLAVDGYTALDVIVQLPALPADATHLVVSAGGNDALGAVPILIEPACSVGEALEILHKVQTSFRENYRQMLDKIQSSNLPVAVCTIYDSVPTIGAAERTALTLFNDVIMTEAFARRLPLIDLRIVCNRPDDYSHVSAIEPSAVGGSKIARAIAKLVTTHRFESSRCEVYF